MSTLLIVKYNFSKKSGFIFFVLRSMYHFLRYVLKFMSHKMLPCNVKNCFEGKGLQLDQIWLSCWNTMIFYIKRTSKNSCFALVMLWRPLKAWARNNRSSFVNSKITFQFKLIPRKKWSFIPEDLSGVIIKQGFQFKKILSEPHREC